MSDEELDNREDEKEARPAITRDDLQRAITDNIDGDAFITSFEIKFQTAEGQGRRIAYLPIAKVDA